MSKVFRFHGGNIITYNPLTIRYYCDAQTRLRTWSGSNLLQVSTYVQPAVPLNFQLAVAGSGTATPPAINGSAPLCSPHYTEVVFNGALNVVWPQMDSGKKFLAVVADGPVQVMAGVDWLPSFASLEAVADRLDWFKDEPIGDPTDPNR